MMNLDELLDEKEELERKSSLNSQESARLNKLLTEISKKSNKSSVVDSFTNNDLKSQLQLQYVNIADIMMPDYDDRSGIDRNKIEELAASIKEHGLIQNPVGQVVIRRRPNNFVFFCCSVIHSSIRQPNICYFPNRLLG